MYSMVLMAALTTGTDVPDFGRRWGCWGCHGCYGWGGWGCYGYGCYGWGGGYGRWGGGYGGWGGGYGGWGGWGAYGGYASGGYGGWGGWSGWGGYAAAPIGYSYYAAAPVGYSYDAPVVVSNAPLAAPIRSMYFDPGSISNNRATVIVHLPAKARLLVDGKPTQSTSSVRRFYTPPLEAGQNYHYVFEAKMDQNGETVTTTKRVDVRPGKTEEVYLKFADLDQPMERATPPSRPAERKGVPTKRPEIDRP
jgi:uncharacterized protein (TIGR03000 family)